MAQDQKMDAKPVGEISAELSAIGADPAAYTAFIEAYESDSRKGVQKFVQTAKTRLARLEDELRRLDGMLVYERRYAADCPYICGIDEVGRGPLAGPVVAAAVILPADTKILYLNDSKKLSASRREELYDEIMEKAVAVGIGQVSHQRIDEINILQATFEAMRRAVAQLSVEPSILLNDAVTIPGIDIPQVPIVKGDAKSLSIAAASVIAKVTRDRLMEEMDVLFPGYGFASNKGYGSAEHIAALQTLGPTEIHRRSFITHFIGENTRETGTWYEAKAAQLLEQHGYRILERNYRCRTGEVDLIAKNAAHLVFIEVKFRTSAACGEPEEAVDAAKQRRICGAARYYMMQHHLSDATPVRLDVIAISGEVVRWHMNAFEWTE